MTTHFSKFRGLPTPQGKKYDLSQKYMKQMVVREHIDHSERLHPSTKKRLNLMTQQPLPLKFKIHPMEAIQEKQRQAREA